MADVYVKRWDTEPLVRQLQEIIDTVITPINLTDATSVKLLMEREGLGDQPYVEVVCILGETLIGEVIAPWGPTDLQHLGVYLAEYEVIWADGNKETVPNDGHFTIEVVRDLNNQ